MLRFLLTATTALTLLAAPALAVPATQAGADRITQTFQTYFGPTAGVVTVAAQGDTYALTLDGTPLMALGADQGLTGQISALKLTLTDNGDGTWAVAMDQPFFVKAGLKDAFDLQESVGTWTLSGTFDEKLLAFATLTSTFKSVQIDETIHQIDQPPTQALITLDDGTLTGTGSANPAGGVDLALTATGKGMAEHFTLPPLAGDGAAMPVDAKLDSLSETFTVTGLRLDGIFPALAWVVAHSDPMAKTADRAEALPLVQAALPLFTNLSATGDTGKLTVTTPFGAVSAEGMGILLDANGLIADGKFREGVTLTGLALPPGLVPAWAAALVPQDATLDVQVTDYDAAAAVAQALTALNLPNGQDPPAGFGDTVLAALMPHKTVTVTLNPGKVVGTGYSVAYEGNLVAGPATDVPAFTAKVTVTGFDTILDALKTSPEEMRMQATMGLGAMRGLAKPGDNGALVWDIDGTTPGTVLVNGMDMAKFGGGN